MAGAAVPVLTDHDIKAIFLAPMSVDRLANMLGVSPGTVDNIRMRRSKRALRVHDQLFGKPPPVRRIVAEPGRHRRVLSHKGQPAGL